MWAFDAGANRVRSIAYLKYQMLTKRNEIGHMQIWPVSYLSERFSLRIGPDVSNGIDLSAMTLNRD